MPFAAQSKAWACGRSLAGIVGSNPAGEWICVSYECFVLSGRGLCVGLITRPEESYRECYIWVWSWIFDSEEALAHWELLRHGKKNENEAFWLLMKFSYGFHKFNYKNTGSSLVKFWRLFTASPFPWNNLVTRFEVLTLVFMRISVCFGNTGI
jgi:hypothetical protein